MRSQPGEISLPDPLLIDLWDGLNHKSIIQSDQNQDFNHQPKRARSNAAISIADSTYELTQAGNPTPPSPQHPSPQPPSPQPPTPQPTQLPQKLKLIYLSMIECPDKFEAYQVQSGDSLWILWQNRPNGNVTWTEMLQANQHLANPNNLKIGQPVCRVKCP